MPSASRHQRDALRAATIHPQAADQWSAASSRPSARHRRVARRRTPLPTNACPSPRCPRTPASTARHLASHALTSHDRTRRWRHLSLVPRPPPAYSEDERPPSHTAVGSAPDQRSNARGNTSMRHLARCHRRETGSEIADSAYRQNENLLQTAVCSAGRYVQNQNLWYSAAYSDGRLERLDPCESLRHSVACLGGRSTPSRNLRQTAVCPLARYLQYQNLWHFVACPADSLLTIEHLRQTAVCLDGCSFTLLVVDWPAFEVRFRARREVHQFENLGQTAVWLVGRYFRKRISAAYCGMPGRLLHAALWRWARAEVRSVPATAGERSAPLAR
jgi:hypothetical protein